MRVHSRLKRARLAGAAVLLLAGCGSAPPGQAAAPSAECRRTVDAGGRESDGPAAWRTAASRAEAPVLDAWCAAVGPAVLEPRPAAGPAGPLDSLAVVSWNTHVGGGDLPALVRDLRAGRLTGGRPARHFVLLLQEAHRSGRAVPARAPSGVAPRRVEASPPAGERLDVVETARRLGLALLYVPSMRNGAEGVGERPEDKGNAVLSTLPLSRPAALELPFAVQRRVVALATVRGTTREGRPWVLRVGSVHFDTRAPLADLLASAGAARLRQARGLAAAVGDEAPILLAGDLNSWSLAALEDAVPYLRGRFPHARREDGAPTFATGWGYRRTLDHLFFRSPDGRLVSYRRAAARYGSDHYPLVAWVPLAAPAPRREAAPPAAR